MGQCCHSPMKISAISVRLMCCAALLVASGVSLLLAQHDPEAAMAIKQADLDLQRLELEKKRLELQQRELNLEKARQELQGQSGRSLSMNLSGDVLFDYDKAELKPASEEALKKVAVVLSQFPESKVTVEGHTDSKG